MKLSLGSGGFQNIIYNSLLEICKATHHLLFIIPQIKEHFKKQNSSYALNVPRAIVHSKTSIALQLLTTTRSPLPHYPTTPFTELGTDIAHTKSVGVGQ